MQNRRRTRLLFGAGTREAHAWLRWKAGRIAGSLVASCLAGFLLCMPVPAADVRNPVVQPGACTGSAEVLCTETGAVQGTVTGGVRAFKGIPYAKPPVGALRFRPPQPAQAWQGTLAADRFGPVCPQLAPGNKVVGSEECLLVNVWTPAQRPAKLLPVMIWLHGGGNAGLSGAGTASYGGVVYDGSLMVERGGVVFVTYNLRLGVLGFLAHPALDAERPKRFPATTAASIRSRCCNGCATTSATSVAILTACSCSALRRAAATFAR